MPHQSSVCFRRRIGGGDELSKRSIECLPGRRWQSAVRMITRHRDAVNEMLLLRARTFKVLEKFRVGLH